MIKKKSRKKSGDRTEVFITREKTGLYDKDSVSISLKSSNNTIDELIEKAQYAIKMDKSSITTHNKILEGIK